MADKFYYNYAHYMKDMKHLVDRFTRVSNPHIVGVYRGSLPIATHLSNALDCPMSIIRFQSRDCKDTETEWILHPADTESFDSDSTLIVAEDIYDTGHTFRKIKNMPDLKENPYVIYTALFGSKNQDGVDYLNERNGQWIVFPWEYV